MTRIILASILAIAATSSAAGSHLGKSLPEWQSQLESGSRVERLIAARSIGEMAIAGDRGAGKAVLASLDSDDSAVRYWGVVALGQMRGVNRGAKARLEGALEDEAADVRVGAAHALVELGDAGRPVEVLIDVLSGPEETARLHAAHALDDIGDAAKAAIPALEKAMSDEFDYVQRVARHALFELGARPCPYRACE